jgi:hypothetical protein
MAISVAGPLGIARCTTCKGYHAPRYCHTSCYQVPWYAQYHGNIAIVSIPQARSACFRNTLAGRATMSSSSGNVVIDAAEGDLFAGATVNFVEKPCTLSAEEFAQQLEGAMADWRSDGRRGVWVHVPLAQVRCLGGVATGSDRVRRSGCVGDTHGA